MAGKKTAASAVTDTGERVKFFHNLEPIRTFIHVKAPRKDKKDKRQLTITFRMPLNGNLVRSAPDFLQTAFAGVRDAEENYVGIKKEIENVTISIFETDKSKKASEELTAVRLEQIAVKEISSSKGDPSIVLTFQTVYPWDSSIWRFLGSHYAGDVFLQFDAAQASLLDLVDVKSKAANDDSQLPLGEEDEEDEEAAGEAAGA
jgi:hypothetical protein